MVSDAPFMALLTPATFARFSLLIYHLQYPYQMPFPTFQPWDFTYAVHLISLDSSVALAFLSPTLVHSSEDVCFDLTNGNTADPGYYEFTHVARS